MRVQRASRPWRAAPLAALSVLLAVASLAPAAGAVSYPYKQYTGTSYAPYATTTALTPGSTDDGLASLALPFAFTIFGQTYAAGTTVSVSTNGVLEFQDTSNAWSNTSLPTGTFSHAAILPYWDDFEVTQSYDVFPTGDGNGLAYGVSGTAPYRVLTIRWTGYRHPSIPTDPKVRLRFYVLLFETDNRIDMTWVRHLTDPMANTDSATVGIQAGGASGAFYQYAYNTASGIPESGAYVSYYPELPSPVSIYDHPAISGTPKVGQTLSVTTGNWNGSPHEYQYQWERCTDSTCDHWTNIAGATNATYTPQAADVGWRVFAAVKGVNGWGASTGWNFAYPVGPVVSNVAVPTNTVAPHVTGLGKVGATLSVAPGTWTGSPDQYGYQWYRCTVSEAGCTPATIAGANGTSYVVTTADVDAKLYVYVTAHNTGGWSGAVVSDNVAGPVPPQGALPVSTVAPSVAGVAAVGATLTTTNGTWSNWPDAYAYEWIRCSDPPGCLQLSIIGGATAQTYLTTADDAGAAVYAAVRAHNPEGWTVSYSGSSNKVGPIVAAPVNSTRPHVSGTAAVGATLSLSTGTWIGAPDQHAYQWYRCAQSSCTPAAITGATQATYVVAAADVHQILYGFVRAHNVAGWSGWVASDNTVGPMPEPTTPPITTTTPVPGATASTPTAPVTTPTTPVGGASAGTLAWSVRGKVTTVRKGKAYTVRPGMTLRCPAGGPSCRIRIVARARVRSGTRTRTITIADARLTAAAGTSLSVRFRLNASGTKLLRAKRRLSATVRATATAGTRSLTATRTITVKRPR